MKLSLGIGAALVLSLGMVGTVAAQSPSSDITNLPHPAHIHSGSCANLGDVVAPLSDVTLVEGSDRVGVSQTQVDLSVRDILASPHAIMAHASADDIGTYIACADLTGDASSGQIVVALDEQNESGYGGVAFLWKDSGKTKVDLSLTAPEYAAGGDEDSSASAATAESVTIKDFKFAPDTLEVSVGTTVTWTNEDSTQHTVTADDGSFDSGTLAQNATFSQTFDTAGTFTYHCKIHPSMTATVIVS